MGDVPSFFACVVGRRGGGPGAEPPRWPGQCAAGGAGTRRSTVRRHAADGGLGSGALGVAAGPGRRHPHMKDARVYYRHHSGAARLVRQDIGVAGLALSVQDLEPKYSTYCLHAGAQANY